MNRTNRGKCGVPFTESVAEVDRVRAPLRALAAAGGLAIAVAGF